MVDYLKFPLVFFFGLFSYSVLSQNLFVKKYFQSGTIAVTPASNTCYQTRDRGFIMAFYNVNSTYGGTDFFLVKADSLGIAQWSMDYGGNAGEEPAAVLQSYDGGYAIIGHTHGFSTSAQGDFLLLKTDSLGNLLWSKNMGGAAGEYGIALAQTHDSGLVAAGFCNSYGAGGSDIYAVSVNQGGIMQWGKAFGGVNDDFPYSLVTTSDSCLVFTGYTNSYGAGQRDIFLFKTSRWGSVEFFKTYGTSETEEGYCVLETADHGFIITGLRSVGANRDAIILKTDSVGSLQWTKQYGTSPNLEAGASVVQTPDSGYVVSGIGLGPSGNQFNIFLLKTDPLGAFQWGRTYIEAQPNFGFYGPTVILTHDDKLAIGGMAYLNSSKFFLMKTDLNGVFGCSSLPYAPQLAPSVLFENSYNPVVTIIDTISTPSPFWSAGALMDCTLCSNLPDGDEMEIPVDGASGFYPNPSSGKFFFRPGIQTDEAWVTVTDPLGKTVLVTIFRREEENHADLCSLSPGIYFCRIETAGQPQWYTLIRQ